MRLRTIEMSHIPDKLKKIVHHATPQSVSFAHKWVAVTAMYHTIGDEYIDKPPRGHKPWMSNNSWTHIPERTDIKANISMLN